LQVVATFRWAVFPDVVFFAALWTRLVPPGAINVESSKNPNSFFPYVSKRGNSQLVPPSR
jgi:hypothetical protein